MNNGFIFRCKTQNEMQTHDVGCALAEILKRGDVLLLIGDLAAGKTTMSRTIFAQKGYTKGFCSPTFAIINEYEKDGDRAYHMDLYRIADPEELEYTGFYECLENGEFTVIEWPEIALNYIDKEYIKVIIDHCEDINSRIFTIHLYNEEQYQTIKEALNAYSCD